MKKFILIFALLIAGTISSFGQEVKTGDAVPQFSVKMLDGQVINIASLKGKVVVINFWATWCPSCRAEMARVDKEILERFEGEELVYLAISRGETRSEVENYRRMTDFRFPIGLDSDSKIFHMFAQSGIPRNYIIDREGNIASSIEGYDNTLFQQLISDIDKTLKKTK